MKSSITPIQLHLLAGKLSVTIVFPIDIARKRRLDNPREVMVEETEMGF